MISEWHLDFISKEECTFYLFSILYAIGGQEIESNFISQYIKTFMLTHFDSAASKWDGIIF